jgi:RNA polymerase sigma factor (sigma-70 family)
VTAHERLPDFQRRDKIKAWVFSLLRVRVQVYRRKLANNNRPIRRRIPVVDAEYNEREDKTPYELVSTAQALRIAHEILELLSDEKREVFILVELEKWAISETALALGIDDATASSRLEIARKEFALAAHRVRIRDTLRGRDSWRFE